MIKLLLDTNFLMLPGKSGIDIFSELERIVPEKHEILVPSGAAEELESIARNSGEKDRVSARVALKLVERKNLKVVESSGDVDGFIKKFAEENENTIVCTNDRNLKRAVKNRAGVIFMRGKSHLARV